MRCEQASLQVASSAVVGTVDGVAVKGQELNEALGKAEMDALNRYCNAVHEARAEAWDQIVTVKLLEREASKAKLDVAGYVAQQRQEAVGTPPSEAQLTEFYTEHKTEDTPEFDEVREAVLEAYQEQQVAEWMTKLRERLFKDAKIVSKLPDVRPPPLKIEVPKHTAVLGRPDSPVTVIEFADYQCPYCAAAFEVLHRLTKEFSGKVRIAYRHFPLDFHPDAHTAALYAQCAKAQGKFWQLSKRFFDNAEELGEAALREHAKAEGLDLGRLDQCVKDPSTEATVRQDMEDAEEAGVDGTPTLFINGRRVVDISAAGVKEAVEQALAQP